MYNNAKIDKRICSRVFVYIPVLIQINAMQYVIL